MTARNTTSPQVTDRTVHITWLNGSELVHYDQSSEWYVEPVSGSRSLVTSAEALGAIIDTAIDAINRRSGQTVRRQHQRRGEATQ